VIEGEAVVINLASGMYYSLNGSGSVVWELLREHHSVGQTAEAVAKSFNVPYETVLSDIGAFCGELLNECLVAHQENGTGACAAHPTLGEGNAGKYEPPMLTKYSDMAELFAADPPLPELPAMSKPEHR